MNKIEPNGIHQNPPTSKLHNLRYHNSCAFFIKNNHVILKSGDSIRHSNRHSRKGYFTMKKNLRNFPLVNFRSKITYFYENFAFTLTLFKVKNEKLSVWNKNEPPKVKHIHYRILILRVFLIEKRVFFHQKINFRNLRSLFSSDLIIGHFWIVSSSGWTRGNSHKPI